MALCVTFVSRCVTFVSRCVTLVLHPVLLQLKQWALLCRISVAIGSLCVTFVSLLCFFSCCSAAPSVTKFVSLCVALHHIYFFISFFDFISFRIIISFYFIFSFHFVSFRFFNSFRFISFHFFRACVPEPVQPGRSRIKGLY